MGFVSRTIYRTLFFLRSKSGGLFECCLHLRVMDGKKLEIPWNLFGFSLIFLMLAPCLPQQVEVEFARNQAVMDRP